MDDRASWLYDSIVGFLKSPEWSVPVMEYIDKNCVVFDTEDENKFEYTTIHAAFCEMVNSLLEGFLMDMGIAPEEFVKVCQADGAAELNEFVFNQILAVDDFLSFKKMMLKRNLELNVQAMSMMKMEEDGTLDPVSQVPGTPPPAVESSLEISAREDEEEMDPELAEAIRLSRETFNAPLTPQRAQAVTRVPDEEDEELKRALAMSMSDEGVMEARAAQEDAELKHAIAMSQAMEEQRLIAMSEEVERQHAAAEAASFAENEAHQRAEAAAAAAAAAADAEQRAAAEDAQRRAAEEEREQAAKKQYAEQMEREAAAVELRAQEAASAKRAAQSLPSLAPVAAPGGGRLAPLAPLSDDIRMQQAQATVTRREEARAPAPAPAPSSQMGAMQMSDAEIEARKHHLLAQRQKIMDKNSAKRQESLQAAVVERKLAPPAPEPEPEPEPVAAMANVVMAARPKGPIMVQPKAGNAAQQRLTQALAAQMRRDLLCGLK